MWTTERATYPEASFDLAHTMALQQLGAHDPTARIDEFGFTKVFIDARGLPQRHRLAWDGAHVHVEVTGAPGSDGLAAWAGQFPVDDGMDAFVPQHAIVRRLAAALPGIRILQMPWRFDVAAGAVLQQRVKFALAASQFRAIATRFGVTGELGVAFPDARRLARVSVPQLQALGIDVQRSRALLALAREHAFRPLDHPRSEHALLRARLLRLPGIGPWTTEMILGFAAGDLDALPVGDVHLPSLVARTLAGEARGTDVRMLELLAPYAGQRFRVVRLLWTAVFYAPHLLR